VVPLAPSASLSIFTDFNAGHKIQVHCIRIFRSVFYCENKNRKKKEIKFVNADDN
jgi:aspartate carbamoyltransferase regulatory subunit